MTQHTPGPWIVDPTVQRDQSGARIFKVVTQHGYSDAEDGLIADVSAWWVDTQSAKANARLIAAAPDLLCEMTAALAEHAAEQHMGGDCACEICDRRRALLAKIKGKE